MHILSNLRVAVLGTSDMTPFERWMLVAFWVLVVAGMLFISGSEHAGS